MSETTSTPVPEVPDISFPDTFTPFRFFTQRVLPTVYGDELSYYEVLCKLAKSVNSSMEAQNQDNDNLKEIYAYLEELQKIMDEFMRSGFDDYYMEMFKKWMDENMWCVMSWASRCVWFGITEDGYFAAYIPDNMNFLDFDVNLDPTDPDYGKLYMSYCQEVYEPCQISCWTDDCKGDGSDVALQTNPDVSVLKGEQ